MTTNEWESEWEREQNGERNRWLRERERDTDKANKRKKNGQKNILPATHSRTLLHAYTLILYNRSGMFACSASQSNARAHDLESVSMRAWTRLCWLIDDSDDDDDDTKQTNLRMNRNWCHFYSLPTIKHSFVCSFAIVTLKFSEFYIGCIHRLLNEKKRNSHKNIAVCEIQLKKMGHAITYNTTHLHIQKKQSMNWKWRCTNKIKAERIS